MQKFGLLPVLCAMLFCGVTQILASPAPSVSSLMPNHTFVDASWKVQLVPGGPMTTINGTIQQVKAQLAVSNPDWKFAGSEVRAAEDFPTRFWELEHWCGEGHKDSHGYDIEPAFLASIKQGVEHLRGTGGAGVSAGVCARISCQDNSAIRWCNDNAFDIEFHTSQPLIDAVVNLEEQPGCISYFSDIELIVGRVHTVDAWNILLRVETC